MAILPADVPLPLEDHFARHVRNPSVDYDLDTKEIFGVRPDAFLRRPEEEGMSGVHLQHFDGDLVACCRAARQALIDGGRTVRDGQALAVIGVRALRAAGEIGGHALRPISVPLPGFPSHAEVRRMPINDDGLAELLAAEVSAAGVHWMRDLR